MSFYITRDIDIQKQIVGTLVSGVHDGYIDLINYKGTNTKGGDPYNRKDCVNNTVEELLPPDQFKVVVKDDENTHCLQWNAAHIQIYHLSSKTMFLVMSDDQFKINMRKKINESLHHFLAYRLANEGLVSGNGSLQIGQTSLDFEDLDDGSMYNLANSNYLQLKHKLDDLIGELDVKVLTVITYSLNEEEKVVEVSAYTPHPDPAFGYLEKDNWSKWITVEYSNVPNQELPNDPEEIHLDIKQSVKDQLNNVELLFKQDDVDEEEGGK
ncbi:DUF5986 family protein [Brevibacillus sp. SYSU BS000544]|uniref:DUF5986 family protein n=1 Tax=Brevibacillus sp. SYSU BS000544 TaxID=3416443 RepID=UPI003CE4B504